MYDYFEYLLNIIGLSLVAVIAISCEWRMFLHFLVTNYAQYAYIFLHRLSCRLFYNIFCNQRSKKHLFVTVVIMCWTVQCARSNKCIIVFFKSNFDYSRKNMQVL